MSQIRLPKISVTLNSLYGDNPTSKNQWTQINPSCVLAYLGLKGYGHLKGIQTKLVEKNGVPLLMYYDIFKNYYANTQEENFYTIGGSTKLTVTINGDTIENPDNTQQPYKNRAKYVSNKINKNKCYTQQPIRRQSNKQKPMDTNKPFYIS